MFTINRQSDYGLRLMVELAKNKDKKPVSLRKFAEKYGISFLFLQRLAGKLRQAKLIRSMRGSGGGYILTKKPAQIKLGDIFRALEGKVAVMRCLKGGKSCPAISACSTKKILFRLNCDINKALNKIKLSDFK
ncbi:MAG: Rrf2 family transcriptional regulator [Patescibacteria group bacterium]|nr:Rrf2 family transcriptional regulator [Patescibacteria group bacterium]MDD5490423.1 Rrf2 family transcriptional regulator [Patescibacteria group bacterium]